MSTLRDIAQAMRPRNQSRALRRQKRRRAECKVWGSPTFHERESPASVKRFADAEVKRYLAAKSAGTVR